MYIHKYVHLCNKFIRSTPMTNLHTSYMFINNATNSANIIINMHELHTAVRQGIYKCKNKKGDIIWSDKNNFTLKIPRLLTYRQSNRTVWTSHFGHLFSLFVINN